MLYRNFIDLAEKYYEPTEKLPSGKTPLEKATRKNTQLQQRTPKATATPTINNGKINFQWSPPKNDQRKQAQSSRLPKVARGADNPNWDTSPHPDYEIKPYGKKPDYGYTFHHKPSGVEYRVYGHTIDEKGRRKYGVEWSHNQNPQNLRDKMKIISSARKVWRDVESRAPHGVVLWNRPDPNMPSGKSKRTSGNTRAGQYGSEGMGGINQSTGQQFGQIGRNPSPAQFTKGARRLKPLDPITKERIKPQRSKISGDLGTDNENTYNIPRTGNPLMDRNRRRLPASPGPAGVRLAD